jgi:pheromone shutdown-related protein TraB
VALRCARGSRAAALQRGASPPPLINGETSAGHHAETVACCATVSDLELQTDAVGGAVTPTPGLPSSVTLVEREGREFYLVGTAHISRKSVEDVEGVIDQLRPDTVCVELCQTRYDALTDAKRWEKLDVFQVIRDRKVLFLLAHLALSIYQRRLGDKFGVKPGSELLAAVEAAKKIGSQVVLADRSVQVTLSRTWRSLGFFTKLRLISALIVSSFTREELTEEDIEKLKESDHLSEALDAFAKAFPQVKEPLIDERDDYLMNGIVEAPGRRVVAVVGAGHVSGIVKRFGQPVDKAALEVVPPPTGLTRAAKWLIPSLVLAAFAVGIHRHDFSSLDAMLIAWILPNALLAGLGTVIAGARPLTVLSTVVASPLTSLNPTINAGIVAGLVEAWQRRPTVEDCQRIADDTRSWRGVYRNRFTRVLLVSALAMFGSAAGAWIGATWLVSLVAG